MPFYDKQERKPDSNSLELYNLSNTNDDTVKGLHSVVIADRLNVHTLFNLLFNMDHTDLPLPNLYSPVPFVFGSVRHLEVGFYLSIRNVSF